MKYENRTVYRLSLIHILNTICNYDPDIIPLLSAPFGAAYARGEDGKFHAEPFEAPEEP